MKKNALLKLLCGILLCGILIGCGACKDTSKRENSSENSTVTEQPQVEISLNKREINLSIGSEYKLKASFSGNEETSASVIWSSNAEEVATVDRNGIVKAVSAGVAVIKAQVRDSIEMCKVTVGNSRLQANRFIHTDKESLALYVGDRFSVQAFLKSGDELIEDALMEWSSKDETIVRVENGIVKAVAGGETQIVIAATYEEFTVTKSLSVTVHAEEIQIVPDFASKPIVVDDKVKLTVSAICGKSKISIDKNSIKFVSSDETVASVRDGYLIANASGNVEILGNCTVQGETKEFSVSVYIYGKHDVCILVDGQEVSRDLFYYGQQVTLELEDVPYRELEYWTVDGERIAGNVFIMPDHEITAHAHYINSFPDDLSSSFSAGQFHANHKTPTVEAVAITQSPVGKDGSVANGYCVVRISQPMELVDHFGSVKYTFDTAAEVLYQHIEQSGDGRISKTSYLKLRFYRPSETELIYLGQSDNNLIQVGAYGIECDANEWVEVKIPLAEFQAVGTDFQAFSIGSSNYFYLDEVSIILEETEMSTEVSERIVNTVGSTYVPRTGKEEEV